MSALRPSYLAVSYAPVFLRLVLAITFLWAGLGKVFATFPVKGESAAILANMGVITPQHAAPVAPPTDPAQPIPTPGASAEPVHSNAPGATAGEFMLAQSAPVTSGPAQYSADDFPEPQQVRRVWGIALRLHFAANPPAKADGSPGSTTWPKAIGSGLWPKYMALAVLVAEIVCGLGVAAGFFTRVCGFALAGVMLGAMWLDQCSPAIQAGNTFLMILPNHDLWSVEGWRPILWQFGLCCSSMALALIGPGVFSADRAIEAVRTAGKSKRPPPISPPAGGSKGGS